MEGSIFRMDLCCLATKAMPFFKIYTQSNEEQVLSGVDVLSVFCFHFWGFLFCGAYSIEVGIEGRIHPRRSVRIEQPRDQGEGEEEVEAEVEGEPGNRTEDLQGHIPEGRVLALEEALA